MDIRQDPNAIPNFNGGGRMGELQANELEQAQSSTQLDAGATGDGGASGNSGDTPVGSGRDSQLDTGSGATVEPKPAKPQEPPKGDPSTRGPGAVDGLVGAP